MALSVTEKVENAILRKIARSDMAGDRAQKQSFKILEEVDIKSMVAEPENEIERVVEILVGSYLTQLRTFVKNGQRFAGEIDKAGA